MEPPKPPRRRIGSDPCPGGASFEFRSDIDNTGYSLYHPSIKGKELIKLLKAEEWAIARTEGSHHILVKGTKSISVPVHGNKDLKKGTLESLKKQGGLK
jgi:predicted RNA binding protein YcfA (HicA-like mRNA interferase family)